MLCNLVDFPVSSVNYPTFPFLCTWYFFTQPVNRALENMYSSTCEKCDHPHIGEKCMIIVCIQLSANDRILYPMWKHWREPSERKVWKPKSSVAAVLTLDIFLRQSFATFTFLPLSLSLSTLCPSLSNTAALDNGGKLNVQLKFMLLPVLYWNTWFDSFMLSFYFVLLQSMTGAVWNSEKKKCAIA